MSANSLDPTTYTDVAGNTVFDAVLDATKLLAWRQNVKAVVDQHATEIDDKIAKTGGTLAGDLTMDSAGSSPGSYSNLIRFNYVDSGGVKRTDRVLNVHPSGSLLFSQQGVAEWSIWNAGNAGPFYKGSGTPEGVVTSVVGGIYQRTDGGASTTLYVKQSGTGNTGWVAK